MLLTLQQARNTIKEKKIRTPKTNCGCRVRIQMLLMDSSALQLLSQHTGSVSGQGSSGLRHRRDTGLCGLLFWLCGGAVCREDTQLCAHSSSNGSLHTGTAEEPPESSQVLPGTPQPCWGCQGSCAQGPQGSSTMYQHPSVLPETRGSESVCLVLRELAAFSHLTMSFYVMCA